MKAQTCMIGLLLTTSVSALEGCGMAQLNLRTVDDSENSPLSLVASDDSSNTFRSTGPVVTVQSGKLVGVAANGSINFLGIPYAEAPTGFRRFKAPIKKAPWKGARSAKAFGSPCPQPTGTYKEDCLFLNVFTPSLTGLRPVMFFTHPALGVQGSGQKFSTGLEFESTRLASRGDVVVVTYNYRLGALGYLVHESLDGIADGGKSGNYGLRDQIMALQWVKENIRQFGGDPENITAFGHSSGSNSTCNLAASPKSRDLIKRTITMSMVCGALPREKAIQLSKAVVDKVCRTAKDKLSCLQSVPPASLVAAQSSDLSVTPSVDGQLVMADDFSVFRNVAPKSYFVGSTSEEIPFSVLSPLFKDEKSFDQIISAVAPGSDLAQLKNDFKPTADVSWGTAGAEAIVYAFWTCGVELMSKELASHGNTVYNFSFGAAGKTHLSIIPPLFQHWTDDGLSYVERALATLTSDFAKGKVPAFDGVAAPTYSHGALLIEDDRISVTDLKGSKCRGFAFANLLSTDPNKIVSAAQKAATK